MTTTPRGYSRKERQRHGRDVLVRVYRTYDPDRAKARGIEGQTGNPDAQHSAPDWVWMTADAIFARTLHLPDLGFSLAARALSWAERSGDPLACAANGERLRTLISLWAGDRAAMIDAFLVAAEKTRSGRTTAPRSARRFQLDSVSILTTPTQLQITAKGAAPALAALRESLRTGCAGLVRAPNGDAGTGKVDLVFRRETSHA